MIRLCYTLKLREMKSQNKRDREYLLKAIEESRKCTPSESAYCVGAVIVTAEGDEFVGYTHETNSVNHAEEEAIKKALNGGAELKGATIYSSMEPCSKRSSKPKSCSELIVEHKFKRAVYAFAEPAHFVDCEGDEWMRRAGIEVEVVEELAPMVAEINSHILGS